MTERTSVWLVQHVSHAGAVDGEPIVHRDPEGFLVHEPQEGDQVKIRGIYSSASRPRPGSNELAGNRGFATSPTASTSASSVSTSTNGAVDSSGTSRDMGEKDWFALNWSRSRGDPVTPTRA